MLEGTVGFCVALVPSAHSGGVGASLTLTHTTSSQEKANTVTETAGTVLLSLCLLSFLISFLPCSPLLGGLAPPGAWFLGRRSQLEVGWDKEGRGDCWDMVLVALFTRTSFWLLTSEPPGNALLFSL